MVSYADCLPLPLNSFIGRERETAELSSLLAAARAPQDPACPAARLITLTGAAGVGKTRLALQVASGVCDDFAHGACFVSLANISDPAQVVSSMLERLEYKESASRPALVRLRSTLQSKQILFVLDNFEQVILAGAMLADQLLASCPRLVLLVTSREMLHVPGEHVYPVGPLPMPDRHHMPPVEGLGRYAAVALFIERAKAADPAFDVTAENAAAVADICYELDGLPLAIELAAARTKMLSVNQIAERLVDRLGFLVKPGHAVPLHRQRDLRAAIDWSYDLLSADEQAMFRCLAVFAGGFSLEAAEAVYGQGNALDRLSQLADKSLIQVEHAHAADQYPRYSMLKTVREYARAKLEQAGEAETAGWRHMAYYVRLAEEAEPHLRSPQQTRIGSVLELERDNLWTAAWWSRQHEPDGENALRLVGALAWLWRMLRGNPTDWLGWCRDLLPARAGVGPSPVHARALLGVGMVCLLQGDYRAAGSLAEQSVAQWESLGEPGELAQALHLQGLVLHSRGLDAEATRLYLRSLTIRGELGDSWGIAQTLNNLASLAEARGDSSYALALYEEGLRLARSAGDGRLICLILIGLGSANAELGACRRSVELYRESLQLARSNGDRWTAPQALDGLAQAVLARPAETEPERPQLLAAARLWGSAEACRDAIGSTIWPANRAEYEAQVDEVRQRLGEDTFTSEWVKGCSLRFEEATAYGLSVGVPCIRQDSPATPTESYQSTPALSPRRAAKARYGGLTEREREVASLLAQGRSNRAIADALVVTERTVTTHVSNILGKLGLTSRTQVAAWAIDRGLHKPPTS